MMKRVNTDQLQAFHHRRHMGWTDGGSSITRRLVDRNAQGDVTATYLWHFPQYARPVLSESFAFNAERTIVQVTRSIIAGMLFQLAGNDYFRILIENKDTGISTRFLPSIYDALEELENKIADRELHYMDDGLLLINELRIITRRNNPENGASSRKRRSDVNETWLVPGDWNSQENCFYVSLEMLKKKERFATQYLEWLKGSRKSYPDFNEAAHNKKKHMRKSFKKHDITFRDSFVNDAQMVQIAKISKPKFSIRIYDGQYKVVMEHKADNPIAPVFEMQRTQNHYRPMIRWTDLDATMKERIDLALLSKATLPPAAQQAYRIRDSFKGKMQRDRRFVSWDLEATTEEDGSFKVYAAGMAWYAEPYETYEFNGHPLGVISHTDGENQMLYISFWGLGAMQQMVDFIAAHRVYFAESYFWAHNGGKFDMPLLLRESLFDYPNATIEGDRCTILNGRWIGFQCLLFDETRDNESRIYFRDSLAMIQGSLAKLCKDYGTPHQKLVETVCHDDITLDNWHTFPQLEDYLCNDCLGLLELIDRFGEEIFTMSYTEKKEKHYGERNTANVLEALLGLPPMSFEKKRPSWLKNSRGSILELDGYCKDSKVAFEYQDPYHYQPDHPFHKLSGDYAKRVADDQLKVDLCAQKGVRLVVVPYTVATGDLVQFCKDALGVQVNPIAMTLDEIKRDRVLERGGICLSQAMTGAGIAKRTFFNAYYDTRMPVYTLTRAQDKFIRNSYFGGRVELFRLGVIQGPVYYLDFTSLYPAMMSAHLLPYGEPVPWSKFPNGELPDNFFGFVRCRVRSTDVGKTRLPLHGVKNATKGKKLCFTHMDGWVEMTLFSEELRKGRDEGLYEYQCLNGIAFKQGAVTKKVVEALFELKRKAKAEGKSSLEKAIKIIINSLYGFWGLRTEAREGVKIFDSRDVPIYDYLGRGALIEEANHGRYTCLRVVEDMDVVDYNVGVAASITSFARIQLWRLMDGIKRAGGIVYSCDTDSVTTDLDLSLHPDLLNEFIPDWETDAPGSALGSLKCECTDEVEKILKKRGFEGVDLANALAMERGSVTWKPMPFHHPEGTLVNAANKLYTLRTLIKHGGDFELCKAKGMSQKDSEGHQKCKIGPALEGDVYPTPFLTFKDYVAMFDPDNPQPLTDPAQMQFQLGIAGYCTDGGIQAIKKVTIEKTAYAKYDKGHVDPKTGEITPFVLAGEV